MHENSQVSADGCHSLCFALFGIPGEHCQFDTSVLCVTVYINFNMFSVEVLLIHHLILPECLSRVSCNIKLSWQFFSPAFFSHRDSVRFVCRSLFLLVWTFNTQSNLSEKKHEIMCDSTTSVCQRKSSLVQQSAQKQPWTRQYRLCVCANACKLFLVFYARAEITSCTLRTVKGQTHQCTWLSIRLFIPTALWMVFFIYKKTAWLSLLMSRIEREKVKKE